MNGHRPYRGIGPGHLTAPHSATRLVLLTVAIVVLVVLVALMVTDTPRMRELAPETVTTEATP